MPGPSQPYRRPAAPRRKRTNRCSTCGKSFSSPGKLAQHQYAHTGERPFVCPRCDKSFSSKFKLMRHVLTHSKERQFQCTECNKGFYRKDHLKNHMETHNPNKLMFRCPRNSCGKEYTSSTGLKKHVAMHEAEDGNLVCTLCGITFQARDDIIFHLKTHAGSRTVKSAQDKKFQCEVCKKCFFTRKDVKRHMVVHTGRRDYVCDLCPQKFGRKDHLVRHVNKSHSSSSGVPARRGRVKTEPPPGPGSPGRSSAPAAAAGVSTAGPAAYVSAGGETYFSEERQEGSGGPTFRPPSAARLSSDYQPPLPEVDLSDPALLFEPPEVLPDLSHTSADLSAVLRAESYTAVCAAPEAFYLPHPRLAEPLPLVRVSEPAAHPPPELFPLTTPLRPPLIRPRLPPPGADLAAFMHSTMPTSSLALPPTAAAAAAELPGVPPPSGLTPRPAEGRRSPSPGQEYEAAGAPPPPQYRYYEEP